GHFFAAAAEAMRRILLNRARDKGRLKREGRRQRLDLEQIELAVDAPHEDLLALDDSIEQLAAENPEGAKGVKVRFVAGLSIDEAAAAMGISPSTAKRHWSYARAWLFDALKPSEKLPERGRQSPFVPRHPHPGPLPSRERERWGTVPDGSRTD